MRENHFNKPIEKIQPCFIEVDLNYPEELHDKFSEYAPAPNNIIPKGSKVEKLAPDLLQKEKYVCHIRNLQVCVKLGVVVEKNHRGLSFEESTVMTSYIDKNTQLLRKFFLNF